MHDKLIVLTGGAGFIGSGVLRLLNDQGFKNIIIVDDLGKSEKWKNLIGKNFVDFVHKHTLFDWLVGKEHEIQAFIHLGACANTWETNANYLMENNFRFSVRLAQYALNHKLRFIYASSAATYGDGSEGFSDDYELESYRPLNMYGFSKHLFDLWLKSDKLLDKVVGLKYFNVFGPNEYHKGSMASAILKMVPDALRDKKIRLYKSTNPEKYPDGRQVRDFIYVKDAAAMTVQFLHNHRTGLFNVGTGKGQTWETLAHAVGKALNQPIEIEYIDMPEVMRKNYQNYTKANMTKSITRSLCMPKFSLDDAVSDYVRNYILPHKHW